MYTQSINFDKVIIFTYDDGYNLFGCLVNGIADNSLLDYMLNKFDKDNCFLYLPTEELNIKLVDYLTLYFKG